MLSCASRMKCNVGGWDRTLRLASGLGVLGFGLLGPVERRTLRAAAVGLGAVQLLTGLSRYCPLNQALGVNTCDPTTRAARQIRQLV